MASGFPSMPGLPGLSRRGRSYGAMMAGLRPTAFWRFNDLASPPSDNSYDATVIARSDTVALWDHTGANLKNPGTHTGTVNGNPVVVEGPLLGAANGGGALDYDGSGDYIEVPYAAALNPSAFTVEAWIWRDADSGGNEHIVRSTVSNTGGYYLRVSAFDKLQLGLMDGAESATAGATSIPTGRWVHVAATYDGTTAKVYLDGVLDGSAADGYAQNGSATFRIGASTTGAEAFNGKIAKPALHNAALTASEIGSLFVKGRPVSDTQGNHAGGMIDAPTSATGAITGDTNACFDFDGSNDAVVIPYSAALNAATFSIAGWIKRDVDTGGLETIASSRTSMVGWDFRINALDKLSLGLGDGAFTETVTAAGIATGSWVHVAATYDGTTARLYVNGLLDGSGADAMTANTTNVLTVGCRADTRTLYFNGKIDELTYHGGRVLTADEILNAYNAGR